MEKILKYLPKLIEELKKENDSEQRRNKIDIACSMLNDHKMDSRTTMVECEKIDEYLTVLRNL